MKQQTITPIIILMGAAMIGMVLLQGFWIRNAINLKEDSIKDSAFRALNEVADRVEKDYEAKAYKGLNGYEKRQQLNQGTIQLDYQARIRLRNNLKLQREEGFGEPLENRISLAFMTNYIKNAVAERGLMVLDGELRGKAGHAARKEGLNAIYEAMKDMAAIAELDFTDQSEWLPEPGAQVTMISAGTRHNVVPDICSYVVDVRSNDCYGNEQLLEMIRSVCRAELTPRSTRLRASGLDEKHFLMQAIAATGLKAFGSSTLSDMALIPFPSVKMGPGESSRSHTAGEYIRKSELERGVEAYCRFLEHIEI